MKVAAHDDSFAEALILTHKSFLARRSSASLTGVVFLRFPNCQLDEISLITLTKDTDLVALSCARGVHSHFEWEQSKNARLPEQVPCRDHGSLRWPEQPAPQGPPTTQCVAVGTERHPCFCPHEARPIEPLSVVLAGRLLVELNDHPRSLSSFEQFGKYTMTTIKYRTADVDGFNIFYREAGPEDAPKLLLLHGFPSAGHMFRELIPLLADTFHIVAPDLPGFGNSDMPGRGHSFDRIADLIDRFIGVVGFDRYAVYVFDYGAPTGFRLAVKHPDRITAIISQNGNAYEEGLSDGWNPIRAYWQDASPANREALRDFLKPETTAWQYTHGVPDATRVSPDGYSLDNFYLTRPGADEVQLDLFGDYKSNVALYPTFQNYFRTHKPRFLAVWGKNDPFFLPAGAEAFKRDIPDAVIRFFDTGHFALETHAAEIAAAIRDFLPR